MVVCVCVCVCEKPYNINEYISRLINKPDSSAPREAYYLLAKVDFFLFLVTDLDSDR